MAVHYEWCYESTDEHGDIEDSDFRDSLAEFSESDKTNQLCLVRRVGDDVNGESDRLYAYAKDGQLPEFFEESSIFVPKRFRAELEKYTLKP